MISFKRKISKLLICGGGFKFFYLVGALKYLTETNIISNIKEYIGVSAGSMLALLFVLGYSTHDLHNFFLEFNFERLISPDIDTFFDNKGLDNGEIKRISIEQFLRRKKIKPDITFLELFEITKIKLSMIVSNISKNELEIINHETYPDMLVTTGITMTTSLPILFEPVIYNNNYYVDGGVFDNYPIEMFDREELLGINMTYTFDNLDFNVDFFNYFIKLLTLSWHFKNYNKSVIYKEKTIDIKTTNTNELVDPNVTLEERIKRIQHGYNTAQKHFEEYEIDILEPEEEQEEEQEEEPEEEQEEPEEKQEEKQEEFDHL